MRGCGDVMRMLRMHSRVVALVVSKHAFGKSDDDRMHA
jgi:hypothetical protein